MQFMNNYNSRSKQQVKTRTRCKYGEITVALTGASQAVQRLHSAFSWPDTSWCCCRISRLRTDQQSWFGSAWMSVIILALMTATMAPKVSRQVCKIGSAIANLHDRSHEQVLGCSRAHIFSDLCSLQPHKMQLFLLPCQS